MSDYERHLTEELKRSEAAIRKMCRQLRASGEQRAAAIRVAKVKTARAVRDEWRKTHRPLLKIDTLGLDVPEEFLFQVTEQWRALRSDKLERPVSICPCCRLLHELQPTCRACAGLGWVGLRMASKLGPDWWRRDYPVVLVRGRKVPVHEVRMGL